MSAPAAPIAPVPAPAPAVAATNSWLSGITDAFSSLIPSTSGKPVVTTAAAAPANPQAPVVAQPVSVAPAAQAGAGKMKGGKKGMKIPAILLYANPFFKGKKNKTNRRKKHGSTKKHRK
jgi:hypothetical protein